MHPIVIRKMNPKKGLYKIIIKGGYVQYIRVRESLTGNVINADATCDMSIDDARLFAKGILLAIDLADEKVHILDQEAVDSI